MRAGNYLDQPVLCKVVGKVTAGSKVLGDSSMGIREAAMVWGITYGASVGSFNGQTGVIRWGGLPGVYNVMAYFPKTQTGIVILTNARCKSKAGSGFPRQLLPKLMELISN
jgi:hypothetical protein